MQSESRAKCGTQHEQQHGTKLYKNIDKNSEKKKKTILLGFET